MSAPLTGTGLALSMLSDGSGTLRGYAQKATGEVVEYTADKNGLWTAANDSSVIVTRTAQLATPIAAIQYDLNGTLSVGGPKTRSRQMLTSVIETCILYRLGRYHPRSTPEWDGKLDTTPMDWVVIPAKTGRFEPAKLVHRRMLERSMVWRSGCGPRRHTRVRHRAW